MITLFDCGIGPNDIIIRWDKKGRGLGLPTWERFRRHICSICFFKLAFYWNLDVMNNLLLHAPVYFVWWLARERGLFSHFQTCMLPKWGGWMDGWMGGQLV